MQIGIAGAAFFISGVKVGVNSEERFRISNTE